MQQALNNPWFPVAAGGLAAGVFFLYKKATCECNARQQKIASLGPTATNKLGHTLDAPFKDYKELVNDPRFTPDQVRFVRLERGIRGSNKYIWRYLPTGQLFLTHKPIPRVI